MTYTLIKADGSTHSWTAEDLSAVLARMIAGGQAVCVGANGIAMMNARDGLLLVDAEWVIGRRLTELFTVEARSGQPYGIGFINDSVVVSVNTALESCAYSGIIPITDLAQVHMVYYDAGSSKYAQDASASGVKLVKSEGVLGGDSAKIKTLLAGTGVTLDGGTDSVTISAPADSRLGLLDDFSWNNATQLLEYSKGGIQALNRLRASGGGVALVDVHGGSHSVRLACRDDKVELVAQTQCPLVLQTYNGTAQVDALRLEASGAASMTSLTVGGQAVVTTNDARLSNARTPAANSVTDASVADGALSVSKISGLSATLGGTAPLTSPVFFGQPRGPPPTFGDDSNWLATTSFVRSTVAALVGAAPSTLNTLDELANALNDDANFASTVATAIGLKADAATTTSALALKAPLASPTFTGTVGGITKAMVGLGNVDNTADTAKPVSTAQQAALDLKASLSGATFSGAVKLNGSTVVQLGEGTTRETGSGQIGYETWTPGAVDIVGAGTTVGSRNVKIWENLTVPGSITSNGQAVVLNNDWRFTALSDLSSAVDLKAPLESPTFTGTVSGISKSMVGLSNVDNTSDLSKPVSTATQAALNLKASTSGATFTSTLTMQWTLDMTGTNPIQFGQGVAGRQGDAGRIAYGKYNPGCLDIIGGGTAVGNRIIKLADNVDVSGILTAGGQTVVVTNDSRLSDARAPTASSVVDASVSATAAIAQSKINNLTTDLALKAPLASPTFTGTVGGITKAMVGLGSVDNTADTAKPVSTAQQTALNLKADLSGASFTGTVSLSGANVLQMGQGVTRESNAGKIAYNAFGFGALDIVGAGTVADQRVVKLYDNVIVNGSLYSTNPMSVGGQAVVLTNDSRLSDARAPTAGSVTDSSVSSSAAISQSKISGLVAALAGKQSAGAASLTIDGYNVGAAYTYPLLVFSMNGTEQSRLTTDSSNSVKFQRLVLGSYVDSLAVSSGGDVTIAGSVYNPGRSYVFAQVTNTQTVAAGATQIILYNTSSTQGSNISYNSTNGRFTVSASGLYTIEAVCRLANYASTSRTVIQIQKNGTGVWEANGAFGIQAVATLSLAANDYIQIATYNGGASSSTITTGSVSSATMRFVG